MFVCDARYVGKQILNDAMNPYDETAAALADSSALVPRGRFNQRALQASSSGAVGTASAEADSDDDDPQPATKRRRRHIASDDDDDDDDEADDDEEDDSEHGGRRHGSRSRRRRQVRRSLQCVTSCSMHILAAWHCGNAYCNMATMCSHGDSTWSPQLPM